MWSRTPLTDVSVVCFFSLPAEKHAFKCSTSTNKTCELEHITGSGGLLFIYLFIFVACAEQTGRTEEISGDVFFKQVLPGQSNAFWISLRSHGAFSGTHQMWMLDLCLPLANYFSLYPWILLFILLSAYYSPQYLHLYKKVKIPVQTRLVRFGQEEM